MKELDGLVAEAKYPAPFYHDSDVQNAVSEENARLQKIITRLSEALKKAVEQRSYLIEWSKKTPGYFLHNKWVEHSDAVLAAILKGDAE